MRELCSNLGHIYILRNTAVIYLTLLMFPEVVSDTKTTLLQLGFSSSQLVLFQHSCMCPQHKRISGEVPSPL